MIEITFGYRKDFFPDTPNHPDSPVVKCKEVSVDICGNILVDGKIRGIIDTACHNYINFDGKDIYGTSLIIKETDDCCSL